MKNVFQCNVGSRNYFLFLLFLIPGSSTDFGSVSWLQHVATTGYPVLSTWVDAKLKKFSYPLATNIYSPRTYRSLGTTTTSFERQTSLYVVYTSNTLPRSYVQLHHNNPNRALQNLFRNVTVVFFHKFSKYLLYNEKTGRLNPT